MGAMARVALLLAVAVAVVGLTEGLLPPWMYSMPGAHRHQRAQRAEQPVRIPMYLHHTPCPEPGLVRREDGPLQGAIPQRQAGD